MTPVHRPVQKGDHIVLVDASNFVFRAYFQSIRQDPKYNYRSDKLPTGALRLFCTKLFQFVEKGAAGLNTPSAGTGLRVCQGVLVIQHSLTLGPDAATGNRPTVV